MNEFALVENNKVTNWGDRQWLQRQFPGTTFASNGPGENWMRAHNIHRVQQRPAHVPAGKKTLALQVPIYDDGRVRGYDLKAG